jgi:tetratricopeptide (TPR) repeat protein
MGSRKAAPTMTMHDDRLDRPSTGALEALYATGHWLYCQDRFAHAQNVFRAMVHLAPRDERGWLALGACHEAVDQHDIAMELYSAAIDMADVAPRCELARARILRQRGRDREALEAIEEAARIAEEIRDDELQRLVAQERRPR